MELQNLGTQVPPAQAALQIQPSLSPMAIQKRLLVTVLMTLAIIAAGAGGYLLGLTQSSARNTKNQSCPAADHAPTNTPSAALESSNGDWKVYRGGVLTFSYPASWEVLREVPSEYRATDSDIFREGWDKEHLRSKMFIAPTCSGPILRNTRVKSTIIAFELVDASSDGAFCWSVGDFTSSYPRLIETLTPPQQVDVSRWRPSDYRYPPTQDNSGRLYSPEWQGDLFQAASIADQNKRNTAVVALVYKNGTDGSAEPVYDRLLSTVRIAE